MKRYLGIKQVDAEPMTESEFKIDQNKSDNYYECESRNGYKVKYKDGYVSWSPKKVFEEAYDEIEECNITILTVLKDKDTFDFGYALTALKDGHKVCRKRWGYHGSKIHLELQVPDEHSKMTLPYIFMYKEVEGDVVRFPCDLSCESLLAEDWVVL